MAPLSDPRTRWRTGYILLLINPFIGLALVLTAPPRWLQISATVLIVALVGAGASLLFNESGGWRPSRTLPPPHHDAH